MRDCGAGSCLVLVTALSSTHSPIYSFFTSLGAALVVHSEQGPALVVKVPRRPLSAPPYAQIIDTQPFPLKHVLSLLLHMLRSSTHSPFPWNTYTLMHAHAHTYTRVHRDTMCRHTCIHRHTCGIHIRAQLHTPTHRHEHTCTEMHTQAHTHVHTLMHTHIHIHTRVHRDTVCRHTSIHRHKCTHMHTHTYIPIRAHLHTSTRRHKRTCTEMHTQAHTHTHTCTPPADSAGWERGGPRGCPARGRSPCELRTTASRAASRARRGLDPGSRPAVTVLLPLPLSTDSAIRT